MSTKELFVNYNGNILILDSTKVKYLCMKMKNMIIS